MGRVKNCVARLHPLRPRLLLQFAAFWLLASVFTFGGTIGGTVLDSSGAVIAGAQIEITGNGLLHPLLLTSDNVGAFASPDLKPGTYSLRITKSGFEILERTVELKDALQLQFTLAVAGEKVSVSVSGKGAAFANSDPIYRQLRDDGLGQTFRFDNFTLTWDAGTFHFEKGTITFLRPVDGIVTGAVFVGEGHFKLTPSTPLDARELARRTGAADFSEDFT